MKDGYGESEGRSVVIYALVLFLLVYFAFPVIPLYLAICFDPSNRRTERVLMVAFSPVFFLLEHSSLYQELYVYEAKLCGLVP